MSRSTPTGMSRRHFMSHLTGASAMTMPALAMGNTLLANADDLKRRRKSAILLWMGGGPSTMDIWDLKPGAPTGGPFRPIATSGDVQISEHMPLMAKQMHNMAIVRSMSTREADHGRGRYYMHTGYVPNPNIEHPSYGAVLSHQLNHQRPELEIPPFVTVGGGSVGPGFLGMAWAPFSVNSNGQVRNLQMGLEDQRLYQRMYALDLIESGFINQRRGSAASDHQKILKKTLNLMTSSQMDAFKVAGEPEDVKERYGNTNFGRGCLMARRLVEQGVPFIEVGLGGWDNHNNIHATLRDTKLPELDQAMSALTEDLEQRGLLEDTAIIWMGEFSRTPRINGNAGRDHWTKVCCGLLAGGGMKTGQVIGATNKYAEEAVDRPVHFNEVISQIYKNLRVDPTTTTVDDLTGRPRYLQDEFRPLPELG